jgi:arylsulfatase A-like enzyme
VLFLLAACRPDPALPPPPAGPSILQFSDGAPRNLLMISIDTLRRDHVDRYATDGVPRMDFLSALLADGVALDDHQQCANWTYHSVSCTLLGRQTEEIGWVAKLNGDGPTPFPDDQPMLAVRLTGAGFRSLLASPISWLDAEWNNTQGYEDDLASGVVDAEGITRVGLDGLRASLDAEPADRWFLHLHFVEPHVTYSPPQEYRAEVDALPPIAWDLDDHEIHYDASDAWPEMTPEEQDLLELHLRTRYTAETRWLDDQLGRIWDTLEDEGWLQDTLVVLWNDHGEAFWEHGEQTHAHLLTAEENDGILAFWADDLQPVGWSGPTHSIDLVPTVLNALRVPYVGLPGYVAGTAPADRPRFTSTSARNGTIAAVTVGGRKLTYTFDGSVRLHDRNTDRAETTNLHRPGDPIPDDLWDLLEPRIELLAEAAPEVPLVWP